MYYIQKAIATLAIATAIGGMAPVQAMPGMSQHHNSSITTPNRTPIPQMTPRERSAQRFFNQGLDKLQKQDYQGAVKDFTQAIQINPKFDTAYVNRADLRLKLGDNKGAAEDYTQAMRTNPNFTYLYNSRGKAREALGDSKGAITDYTQATKLYPEEGIAFRNRGILLYKLGQNQAAMEDLNQAIERNHHDVDAYTTRSNLRAKLGDKQGAIKDRKLVTSILAERAKNAEAFRKMSLIRKILPPDNTNRIVGESTP